MRLRHFMVLSYLARARWTSRSRSSATSSTWTPTTSCCCSTNSRRQDFARRRRDPEDRRRHIVEITDAGRAALRRAERAREAIEDDVLGALDSEERETLRQPPDQGNRGLTMHRRYVIADVFTDTPLEGNQLAVFTDGSGLSDRSMQRAAREMNLSETVFVLPARGRCRRADPDLHAVGRAAVRGPSGARHRVRRRGAARHRRVVSAPDRRRRDPGRADARGRRDRVRRDGAADSRPPSRSRAAEELLAALGRRALGAAGRGIPQRSAASSTWRSRARTQSPRSRPICARAQARLGLIGVNCFAGVGATLQDADVRSRARACPRIRRPARPPARWRSISCATAGSSSASSIEIRQGAEIGRPSLLRAQVDGSPSGSSASRSGARR